MLLSKIEVDEKKYKNFSQEVKKRGINPYKFIIWSINKIIDNPDDYIKEFLKSLMEDI